MNAEEIKGKILEEIASFPRATKLTYLSFPKKSLSAISIKRLSSLAVYFSVTRF
jgi:hypothetical protein